MRTVEWKRLCGAECLRDWGHDGPHHYRCGAKRAARGTVTCEREDGHCEEHIGRGVRGQWFFWAEAA